MKRHDKPLPTRQEILVASATLALAATGPSFGQAPAVARGTVFDADSSPRRGIANVMVSNGLTW